MLADYIHIWISVGRPEHLPSLNLHSEEQRCKSMSQTPNVSLLDLGKYDDLCSILRKNRVTQEHRHSVEWKWWWLPFRGLNLSHILHVHRFHLFIYFFAFTVGLAANVEIIIWCFSFCTFTFILKVNVQNVNNKYIIIMFVIWTVYHCFRTCSASLLLPDRARQWPHSIPKSHNSKILKKNCSFYTL